MKFSENSGSEKYSDMKSVNETISDNNSCRPKFVMKSAVRQIQSEVDLAAEIVH